MDKINLIKCLAGRHPQLKAKEAEKTVKVILDALCGSLAKGGRIEIRGFGSFSLSQLPPKQKPVSRTGFKPKDPPRYIPHFKPAKELRARACKVNEAECIEICQPQLISPDRFNHNVANDSEHVANYA